MFSIIIATKDRKDKLERCLDSINADAMVESGSELILVDNGSTDSSLKIIREFQQKTPFPVSFFQETRKGLSFCRNRGIRNAKGDLVIFTDDDCYMAKDYLKAAKKIFQDNSIGFATGRVALYDKEDCPIMTCNEARTRTIDQKSLSGVPKIIGANLIIRKSVIEKVGWFDILFGSGTWFAGDDIDYISRVLVKGFKGIYDPSIIVYHHHGRKDKDVVQNQERFYAKGIGAQYCKRILSRDASALNALLFAVSKANRFSLFELPQEEYKDEMLKGALEYLRIAVDRPKKPS